MIRPPLLVFVLCLTLLAMATLAPAGALANAPAQVGDRTPADFSLLLAGRGVTIYLSEEEPDDATSTGDGDSAEGGEATAEPVLRRELMQVVDLSTGARLTLHHGPILERGNGDGIYGGPNPRIQRQYLETVWQVAADHAHAFCVSNGTFFLDMQNGARVDPTELSFPLKSDGLVVSEGNEHRRFRNARVMLELWSDHATIVPLSRQAFYSSDAPDVVVGLSPRASLRSLARVGRSWIGTADHDGDGLHEILYLYSALAVTQSHAERVMRAFGAQAMLMLDGGGSTQLICEGDGYITQSRPLPQTLITLQAPPPPLPWPMPRVPIFGVGNSPTVE
ncbi:MAG: hypothetical protein RRC07_16315 [Anaerolineae bacterium]|nr:hypothetical protein [Anaerolineae bacterium]